jgi:hypothetical protein
VDVEPVLGELLAGRLEDALAVTARVGALLDLHRSGGCEGVWRGGHVDLLATESSLV